MWGSIAGGGGGKEGCDAVDVPGVDADVVWGRSGDGVGSVGGWGWWGGVEAGSFSGRWGTQWWGGGWRFAFGGWVWHFVVGFGVGGFGGR